MKGLEGIYGFKCEDTDTSEKIIFGFKVLRHWKGHCLIRQFLIPEDYVAAFDEHSLEASECFVVPEDHLLSGLGENCMIKWYADLEGWYNAYKQDELKPKRQSA